MSRLIYLLCCFILAFSITPLLAQKNTNKNKFRQLGQELPSPNVFRAASGAPGHLYWQQQANYKMDIHLDDAKQKISGEESITYINNSPDELTYLWLQLDQNMRAKDSDTYKIRTNTISDRMNLRQLKSLEPSFDGGFKIEAVTDENKKPLHYTINKTMMRVDLPKGLKIGEQFTFNVKWWYNINNRQEIGGRSGFEYFEEEDNYLYTIAQFFPRMCVYDDVNGWQHKQFLGRGEFALPFGDYEVSITVPADHQVSATGLLQNEKDILSKEQLNRLKTAEKASQPVMIVTADEAAKAEENKSTKERTWVFKAENVRDFGFASSRKFIWDAIGVPMSDGRIVMAMSMYPKEGNPLWEKYSTKSVAHTLKWYSHYTFDYPYPVAWSVHTDRIGMEYPMICFNGGRPEADGTYTERTKYGLISVIIHEVGHNYFPMIVNSDERQWTWMDEGLNTYVQFITEQEWERDYPSRRGPANNITDYMSGDKNQISPIMTNSESIHQFGNNAYGKPATALNILRETIMGRELFDHAFKTYCHRWKFKHPSPADFFRTMEDASGTDLDWFWRGWFYTTDHVDIAIKEVKPFLMSSKNPATELAIRKDIRKEAPKNISSIRNKEIIAQTEDEKDPSIKDFYTNYDPLDATERDKENYKKYLESLSSEEKKILNSGKSYYEITFENLGGLVMPIILNFEMENGTTEYRFIPAEIWKINDKQITKVFVLNGAVKNIVLDPFIETADIETSNNYYPPRLPINRFELFKDRNRSRPNPMQQAKQEGKKVDGTN